MHPRSPVVAILGHVDHGKTSLLDFIRKSRIADREFGGITQKIGAYEIETGISGYSTSKITFIDTPGHEAFSKLRARGAKVADIAILIVDAKDSLMPQTIESIFHIKEAGIPMIVALNKVDLPDANPKKVHNDLLKYEVLTEEKGGSTIALEISAKTGKGVPELLEAILLQASELNLQYDEKADPIAYIIETKKDRRGCVVSAIIKEGEMHVTGVVYADDKKAKIRSMINDLGKQIQSVTPSTPFELLGFEELPDVGIQIKYFPSEFVEKVIPQSPQTTNMRELLKETPVEETLLTLVIKTDSQGSLEAVTAALAKNPNIKVILSAVGDIHRSDIFLAKTTKSIAIGFSVAVDSEVKELAKQEKVVIKTYNIIYELLDELEEVSDLIREKEESEKNAKGEAKILATFIIEGEKIFGVKVNKGKMNIGDSIELYRSEELIGKTKLISLKYRAKNIQEAKKDQEAGMIFNPPLDIKVGDMIKSIL